MRFLVIFMALLFLALSTLLFIYAPIFFGLLFLVLVFCAIFWAYPKGTLLFFLIFMLLQGPIAQLTRLGIIFNLEELGILAMAFLVFAKRLVLRKPFYPMAIGKPLFMLLLIGAVSSIIYHIVPGIVAFGGAFLFLKGFMLYYIFLNVDITFEDVQKFKRWFYGIGILTVMYAILGIVSWDIFLKPIGIRPSERFGIPALQSYLGHPGTFSALMGVLICFVVVDILIRKKMRHNLLFILFLTATIFSFRRTTLLGVIIACIVIVFSKQIRRIIGNRTSLKMLSLVAGVCVLFSSIIFVSYKDLSSYVNQESPRSVLLKTGIKIATDFFPLGSGFDHH